jgi:hypothetical protein
MDTLSPSTTTGTFRTPFEYVSISSNFILSTFTSKYAALSPKTSLALSVWGQPAFPNIIIFSAMGILLVRSEIMISQLRIKLWKQNSATKALRHKESLKN